MTPHDHHHQNGHSSNSEHNPGDELTWTAYLYSAGELSEAEAVRFEERLEIEPAAQAALAEAVALAAGVSLAESTVSVPTVAAVTPSRNGFDFRRAAGWILVATAASVALWLAASQPQGQDVAQHSNGQRAVGQAQNELAIAWIAGQPSEDELLIVEETMLEDESLAESDSHPVIEEPSAPDWLIAALVDAQSSPERSEN